MKTKLITAAVLFGLGLAAYIFIGGFIGAFIWGLIPSLAFVFQGKLTITYKNDEYGLYISANKIGGGGIPNPRPPKGDA